MQTFRESKRRLRAGGEAEREHDIMHIIGFLVGQIKRCFLVKFKQL